MSTNGSPTGSTMARVLAAVIAFPRAAQIWRELARRRDDLGLEDDDEIAAEVLANDQIFQLLIEELVKEARLDAPR